MRNAAPWLLRVPFAHRGLHDAAAGVPENSCAAFRAAAAVGYGIELDLRLSGDDRAVVFHDGDLDRLTEATGPLRERSADELGRIRLRGSDQAIPSLAQALEAIGGRVPVLLELKTLGTPIGPLEEAVWRLAASYAGPFAVQSFEPATVAWFRRRAPEVCRGQIASRYRGGWSGLPQWRRFLLRNLAHLVETRPDYIAYDIDGLPQPAVSVARRLGLPVLAWTVRSPADLAKARTLADNVIFEQIRPDAVVDP